MSALSALYWREPLWLLLALQPFVLFAWRALRTRHQLRRYALRELHPWVVARASGGAGARLFSREALNLLAWVLLAMAAAGPRLPADVPAAATGAADEIMVVMDVSRSMDAADVPPSRRRRARLAVYDLAQALHRAKLGIIVFAARPHVLLPLTDDPQVMAFFANTLDTLTLPTAGSDPAAALALARAELPPTAGKRSIVLITDGDFAANPPELSRRLLELSGALDREHIRLDVLGVGTVEGDAIALRGGGWLSVEGRPVISRMNEALLERAARLGGGEYNRVGDDDNGWVARYRAGGVARSAPALHGAPAQQVVWRELYTWPLLPAIALLFLVMLPCRGPLDWLRRRRLRTAVTLGVLLLIFAVVPKVRASETQASAAFEHHDYVTAAALYRDLTGYRARLGEGASAYRLGQYDQAARQFTQAVLQARDDSARGVALHDLGNSYFQLGDYAAAADIFRDALRYRPRHAATERNLALSVRLQQQVAARLESRTAHAGSGPRRMRTDGPIDVDEHARLSLSDEDQTDKKRAAPPSAAPPSATEVLIQRGLQHARLAAANPGPTPGAALQPGSTPPTLALHRLADEPSGLWKTIFEHEEGFPAPLEQPAQLPGVAPW